MCAIALGRQGGGMSSVILEAMACAVPVVILDPAGNRDVLGGDRTKGWLVPRDDPEVQADAMPYLLEPPSSGRS